MLARLAAPACAALGPGAARAEELQSQCGARPPAAEVFRIRRAGSAASCSPRVLAAPSFQGTRRTVQARAYPGNGQELLTKEAVVHQARDHFLRTTRAKKPDELISPAEACLTIALEEEAAAQVFVDEQVAAYADDVNMDVQKLDLGRPSTWSLERLDLLADEAMSVFKEQLAAAEEGEGMDDMAARLEALDPADRVDLSQVLELKPKPRRSGASSSSSSRPVWAMASPGPKQLRVELFPLLMVNSINEVLYERHGYRRSQQHGEPRDGQINTLLEGGEGSPVLMGILYMEICRRVGLPVASMPIDDDCGQYFLLWPTKFPLRVGGHEFVVDPYGNGDLLLRSEVREMFDLVTSTGHCAIRPASNREILAALLSQMRTSYWARGVGCSPEPAFIESLDCTTVMEMWWGMEWDEGNFNLSRALACAERQVHLIPRCQKTQLQYALLQYATGDYETAWQELAVYLERGGCTDPEENFQARMLLERLKLFLEFDIPDRESSENEFLDLEIEEL